MPRLLPQSAPRHDAERQNSQFEPLMLHHRAVRSQKSAAKMSKMRPTRRWRTSGRFFAYFGTSSARKYCSSNDAVLLHFAQEGTVGRFGGYGGSNKQRGGT